MFDINARYSFSFPTSIRFGFGVIDELSGYLKENQVKNPLMVTDPVIGNLDFFKQILNVLKKQGFGVEVFSEMHKNPVKSDVLSGGDYFHHSNRDCIIGIGGGVAMDVARAICLRVNHHRDLFDYDDLIGGDKYVTEPVPLFVTVPTTSGTGSEVGRSAIISEDESKKKRILFHPKLLAKMVFADPQLTMDLPPFITAATGMDALTHNLEAFLVNKFHPMCDGIALEGIALINESIEKATNHPDPESRSKMMMGSLMGAVAFQKGLGIVHAMSHPLSTLLDMHHGLANAINLPHALAFNIPGQEPKFKRIAQVMNLETKSGEAVIKHLTKLNQEIGLPSGLMSQGVKEEHLNDLVELAINDFALPNNPRKVIRDDFYRIYRSALV